MVFVMRFMIYLRSEGKASAADAARRTALTIFTYPQQRQRFGFIPARIWASVGWGF